MLMPPFSTRWFACVSSLLFTLVGCQPPLPVDSTSPLGTPLLTSALESPLAPVGTTPDFVLFQRVSESQELSFSVQFDQNLWEYGEEHVYGPSLFHHHLIGCALALRGYGAENLTGLRTIALAGRKWNVSATEFGEILYESPPFAFFLNSYTSESLVENKLCQEAGEQVIATFAPLATAATPIIQIIGGSCASEEPWVTVQSQKGGFRFRHPASWGVVESELGRIALWPPTGQYQDRIWLNYLDVEKPEEADLQRWLESYFALGLGYPHSPRFSPIRLNVTDPQGPSQQLYNETQSGVHVREYYITHGRLVLNIVHGSQRVGQKEVLRRVADSIQFTTDAPTDLTQLYYPEPPSTSTGYLTIEAYQQRMRDGEDALAALNLRTQTGQEPIALLAAMSEQARAEYERLLIQFADHINLMDQQRADQALLSPLPTPNVESNSP
jgi:hypothetical protein